MSLLELHQISKSYGEGATAVRALDEIDLSVDEGHLVAVMGPSGSGKSTLLTIAGSLEEPTSGEVAIDGVSLRTMSRNDKARLRRRTIGYVFQDFNLLPGSPPRRTSHCPSSSTASLARKAHQAGLAALEQLGMADRAGHYPDQLSGGERQRVAIARVRGRRAPSPPRRRAIGCARLDQQRGGDADDPRRVQAWRRRGRGDPRRPPRLWADRVIFLRDGRCRRPRRTRPFRFVPR
jgi:putative ABC transport system ATP-binding protein